MDKKTKKRLERLEEIAESYSSTKKQKTGSPHRMTAKELRKRLGDIRNQMTAKEEALYRKSKNGKTVAEMFHPPKKKTKAGRPRAFKGGLMVKPKAAKRGY